MRASAYFSVGTEVSRAVTETPLKLLKREACPVCRFTDTRVIYQRMFAEDPVREYLCRWYRGKPPIARFGDSEYVVMECPSCGLLFQRDVLDDEGLALLYGSWINPEASAQRNPLRARREGLAIARRVHALGSFLDKQDGPATVVELGCGWGNWLLMARAFGYAARGIEIDDRRREFVVAQGIPCYRTPGELADASVDFIYAQQVFEHLRDPLDVLRSLTRSLRPGGYVHIAVPNARWVKRNLEKGQFVGPKGIRHSLNPIAPLEHVNAFAGESLKRMGEACGLSVYRRQSAFLPARTLCDYIETIPRFLYGIVHGHAATSILFRKE